MVPLFAKDGLHLADKVLGVLRQVGPPAVGGYKGPPGAGIPHRKDGRRPVEFGVDDMLLSRQRQPVPFRRQDAGGLDILGVKGDVGEEPRNVKKPADNGAEPQLGRGEDENLLPGKAQVDPGVEAARPLLEPIQDLPVR